MMPLVQYGMPLYCLVLVPHLNGYTSFNLDFIATKSGYCAQGSCGNKMEIQTIGSQVVELYVK